MHTTVHAALAAQYEAFRSPAPSAVEGCPCCSEPEELQELVATPRHILSAPQLEFYASSALLTVGDVADLRHYWPRLAELSVAGDLLTDAEIVFAKPRHGQWRTWPIREQKALLFLAHAQIESLAAMGSTLDDYAIETWVCAFGQFVDDVTVMLEPLLRPESEPAAALRGWYRLSERQLAQGELWSAFWECAPGNASRVRAWFAKPEVLAAIDRAFTPPLADG